VALELKTMTVEGHDYRISFIEDPNGYLPVAAEPSPGSA
jgi:hypothetical protein